MTRFRRRPPVGQLVTYLPRARMQRLTWTPKHDSNAVRQQARPRPLRGGAIKSATAALTQTAINFLGITACH